MSYKDNYDDYDLLGIVGKLFWRTAAQYWAKVDELAEVDRQIEVKRRKYEACIALLGTFGLDEDREHHPPVSRDTGQVSGRELGVR